jgi:hypothetical protein
MYLHVRGLILNISGFDSYIPAKPRHFSMAEATEEADVQNIYMEQGQRLRVKML